MFRTAGLLTLVGLWGCAPSTDPRLHLIVDTDANNELDDQHALVWAVLQGERLVVEAVTVNATLSGGDVEAQRAEARRVLSLAGVERSIPLKRGANGQFDLISPDLGADLFDGSEAVSFIVDRARASSTPLTVLCLGKLTNLALALAIAPDIANHVRIVWLGTNFPAPGEYNLENDPAAVSFVMQSEVPFEIVTVRYGEPTGTDAVRVTRAEISSRMPGRGPRSSAPIEGRHGGLFSTFGDYSVDLFAHAELNGEPPSRALFDLAAAAILAHPEWARRSTIPAPALEGLAWVERPEQSRTITLWEHFNRDAVVEDLFRTLNQPTPATP